jgi:hypothetical protein
MNAQPVTAHLVATQFRPGQSGNPSGKPASKFITDAMRLLLANNREAFIALPKPLKKLCGAWYSHAVRDPRGLALILDRIEGKIGDGPERALPNITFIEQHFAQVGIAKPPPRVVDVAEKK